MHNIVQNTLSNSLTVNVNSTNIDENHNNFQNLGKAQFEESKFGIGDELISRKL